MRFTTVDIECGAKKLISQDEAIRRLSEKAGFEELYLRTFVETNIVVCATRTRVTDRVDRRAGVRRAESEAPVLSPRTLGNTVMHRPTETTKCTHREAPLSKPGKTVAGHGRVPYQGEPHRPIPV